MIFTYWEGEAQELKDFLMRWLPIGHVKIYTRHDIGAILTNLYERAMFARLRSAAARASVARFLLLREFGGFYVEPNTAPGDPSAIQRLVESLTQFQYVVFVDSESVNDEIPRVLNSAILSQKHSRVVDLVWNSIYDHLASFDRAEAGSSETLDYDLASLAGSGPVARRLFRSNAKDFELNRFWGSSVKVEVVSRSNGHPAFSMISDSDDARSTDRTKTWPLFDHRTWDDAAARALLDRLETPMAPHAFHKWRGVREKIIRTGPILEEDIPLLREVLTHDKSAYDAMNSGATSYAGNDVEIAIENWQDSAEELLNSYYRTLTTRALKDFYSATF